MRQPTPLECIVALLVGEMRDASLYMRSKEKVVWIIVQYVVGCRVKNS